MDLLREVGIGHAHHEDARTGGGFGPQHAELRENWARAKGDMYYNIGKEDVHRADRGGHQFRGTEHTPRKIEMAGHAGGEE